MATKKAATGTRKRTMKHSNSAGSRKKTARKTTRRSAPRKCSAHVMETSDALDLESKVFKSKEPLKIARSLKRSAERSKRRKGTPFQSAMSMLNFYINRAGKNLPQKEKQPLEKAKGALRQLFHKEEKK